jgi:uncharacterized protein YPO0396
MEVQRNSSSEGGFRLRALEIFNWGTFNGKVYKLQPNGRTSLLTGANGSGKTTLIDALLTLIVPSNKRFYNQSSGAESKKERDESSYFWGYYGKTYSDEEEKSSTEQLRSKSDNPYSVLLATFQNSATQQSVTLVQVRWFANGGIKKVYIVSLYQLNINDHFGKGHFDIKGEWKKQLQKQFPKTDIFESFKDYAARFSEMFGLKEKALSLFNQTVGIKVLGDLTTFIRQHMLEEPDNEEQFKSLHNHYTDLLISHNAIKKDEKQLEMLTPIVDGKALLATLKQEVTTFDVIREQLPHYFRSKEFNLLERYISKIQGEIDLLRQRKMLADNEFSRINERHDQLITQKAQLNVDSQVQLLKKDIQIETEKRDSKRSYFNEYIQLSQNLGFQTDVDEQTFNENLKAANLENVLLTSEHERLTDEKARCKIDKEARVNQIAELQDEITSLLSRENRIPRELIAVRKRLVNLLEINENDLPFAGELIRLNEDNRHWEDAIERVLHSFSMRLLVPEQYLKQVNQFVHSNSLQTKLVYEKIEGRNANVSLRWPTESDALINKLEFKESGIYQKWIEQQLYERFNYHCTDDLDVFYGSTKAVTSNGLIRNINRHEKDDRVNFWDKSKYRLGWDNKESVHYLEEQKRQVGVRLKNIANRMDKLQPEIAKLSEKQSLVTIFISKKIYSDIDWSTHGARIQLLTSQMEALLKSNDKYQEILKQLSEVGIELESKRKENESLAGNIATAEQDRSTKQKKLTSINLDGLNQIGETLINQFFVKESFADMIISTLDEFDALKEQTQKTFDKRTSEASKKLNVKEIEVVTSIGSFVHPEARILNEFPDWSGDTMNMSPSLDSLDELDALFTTIKSQRLIEHKKRFQEYMDRSMLDALTNFRTWLVNEEEKIKEVIEELNVPLRKITFNTNPDTYLQLECKLAKDPEIKAFKEQLSATIPNTLEFATQKDESYRQMVFEKIKAFINELQTEELWRRRVTDIRNWLIFSAREYSIADNKVGQYHDNTASYSGGQKAQFTYAILGAAISHQFGIYEQGKQHRSLRFITVDEAFSKLDPEKSEFLMKFCAQLNLQILVVTPFDKINIAEPFIHAVHFVEIKNKKNSIVYNLSMQEYEERKEEFKQLAKLDDNS